MTQSENQQHALEKELRKYKHVYCFNKDKKLVAEYKTIPEACRAVDISQSTLWQALHTPKAKLTKDFYWDFSPELRETIQYQNTGKAKVTYQYDLNGKFLAEYPSTGAAARATHSNRSHIGTCCRGGLKSHNGFIWRYAEDIVSPSEKSEEV